MSSPDTPRWRLEIELADRGRRRTVSLDYRTREALDRQLAQLRDVDGSSYGRLLEFRNESGEELAVVAAIYARHSVRAL
jgi:hypothetical protein